MQRNRKISLSVFYLLLGAFFLISLYISKDFPVYSIEKAYHRFAQSHFIVDTDIMAVAAPDPEDLSKRYVFAIDGQNAYCADLRGTGNPFMRKGEIYGTSINVYSCPDRLYAALGRIADGSTQPLPLFLYDRQLEANRASVTLYIYDDGRQATTILYDEAKKDENNVFLFWFDGTDYQLEALDSILEIADSHVPYSMTHASDNYFLSWADVILYKDDQAIYSDRFAFTAGIE